jgi:hypothetical protein
MVPRDLFDRMAILALVAIILFCSLFVRAFAVEADEYLDSGPVIVDDNGEPPISTEDSSSLLSEVAAIRQSLEIILYFMIPCSVAVLVVYLLCKWFCRTFVESVL